MNDTIGELKNRVKLAKAPQFDYIPADALNLWLVEHPVDRSEDDKPIKLSDFGIASRSSGLSWRNLSGLLSNDLRESEALKLHPMDRVSNTWSSSTCFAANVIRIVINRQI
ncbi:hypothetical protein BGZ68_004835 [Mortierella alpina]|nr:hypothetical protein BGZ68_004835 [Mortierella alpina]